MRKFPELEKGMIVYRPKGIWRFLDSSFLEHKTHLPSGRILAVNKRSNPYGVKDGKSVLVDFGRNEKNVVLDEYDFCIENGILVSTFGAVKVNRNTEDKETFDRIRGFVW